MVLIFRYACSRSGHIFEIDIQKVSILHVRRLLPAESRTDKQTFRSGNITEIHSRSGHVLDIDIQKVSILHVRRLLPAESKTDKQTFRSGNITVRDT